MLLPNLRPVAAALLLVALPVSAFAQTAEPESEADSAAELFPGGMPSLLTPESMSRTYRLPPNIPPPGAKKKVPTGIDYSEGPVKLELGTNVTANKPVTTSVIPQIPDPKAGGAAGGSGEVKGELHVAGEQWELYGRQKFGVVQADGATPAPQASTTFGSLYQLPDWMAGGKVGASFELAPTDERKTRIEYRRKFGPAEGFVAAEQTFAPDRSLLSPLPPTVRSGVSRKF